MKDELVVIYAAKSEPEAVIVQGRLDANGIQAIVQGESVGTIYGFTGGRLGTHYLLVRPEDEEEARRILSTPGDGDLEPE